MVNSNELLTTQRRVFDIESGIFEYDKKLKQQNNNLRNLLDVKYDYDIEMIDIDDIDIPQNEVYSIKTEYVKKNPDVILARLELLKAFKNIKKEERSWWPTISFNANTDVVKLNLGLGLSIDMPFLDWVNVHHRIKISKIEYQQKRLNLITVMKKCINDMYYNIKLYEETNELLENGPRRERLNETYDDVDIDTTTKLETENNRINEEIRLLQLKHDVVKARLVLQQLTN
jgi:outer membrane protein TolC